MSGRSSSVLRPYEHHHQCVHSGPFSASWGSLTQGALHNSSSFFPFSSLIVLLLLLQLDWMRYSPLLALSPHLSGSSSRREENQSITCCLFANRGIKKRNILDSMSTSSAQGRWTRPVNWIVGVQLTSRVFGQRIRQFTWKKCIFRQIAKSLPLHLATPADEPGNRIPRLVVVARELLSNPSRNHQSQERER